MPGKILIIEDEVKIAGMVKQYLLQEHYDVLVASDGLTGLKMARRNNRI